MEVLYIAVASLITSIGLCISVISNREIRSTCCCGSFEIISDSESENENESENDG